MPTKTLVLYPITPAPNLNLSSSSSSLFLPAAQLFDLIYREDTLFNVIKSVTRNGRSILLTALLALILVYLFSIVGFLCLKDDFIMEVDRLPQLKSTGQSGLETSLLMHAVEGKCAFIYNLLREC